jgi:hypothetical protein
MKKFFSVVFAAVLLVSLTAVAGAEDILLCKKTYSNGVSKYAFPSGSTGMCPSDWVTISLQEALAGMLTDLENKTAALEAAFVGLDTRVTALETTLTGMSNKVLALETSLAGVSADLDSRIDVLESLPISETEVPENDYVYITNVNSGWVNVPLEYYRADTGWFDLIRKPDGRPYSNYYYDGYWHRTYYYKLRCATVPGALAWRYPNAMGGALVFPGIQMCQ